MWTIDDRQLKIDRYTFHMGLTIKDIDLIKEALKPEFNKINFDMVRLEKRIDGVETRLGNRIDHLDMKIDQVKNELENKIDVLEGKIEKRFELSEKNIIETMGELHQDHEKRIQRIEKVIHIS